MGLCCRSFILLVQKFRTSEMLEKWSTTSKLCDVKLSHTLDSRYIFHLHENPPVRHTYYTRFSISSNLFSCLLLFRFDYCISCQLWRFKCKTGTVYVLHNFSNVLVDWYFSWRYLNFHWLSFWGVFSLRILHWRKKEPHRENSPQKCFTRTLSKISLHIVFQGKLQFFQPR